MGPGLETFAQEKEVRTDKFRQLEEVLPTPNERRTASGAPGPAYWQQRADYVIDVEIDEVNHSVSGAETITYTNNSPHSLSYLWLQLDPNL
ncbi:MAG: aminopeptidase, partial [Planctomycetota bacterium]|nr:aminopeptidase [Planctomycetota bacterium]